MGSVESLVSAILFLSLVPTAVVLSIVFTNIFKNKRLKIELERDTIALRRQEIELEQSKLEYLKQEDLRLLAESKAINNQIEKT